MLINPKVDNASTSPLDMDVTESRIGNVVIPRVDEGSKSDGRDRDSRFLVYISVDDFYQRILFLCKSLESTARTAQLGLRVEAFLASVKAAEEKFKSSMLSGIVTISILAPGVAFSAYLLAGAKGFSFTKGAGDGSKDSLEKKSEDSFALGNLDKGGEAGPSLHKDSVSSQADRPSLNRGSVSSQPEGESAVVPRHSPSKAEANSAEANKVEANKVDANKSEKGLETEGQEGDASPASALASHKTSKPVDDQDRRGAFQGMSMFILPSGSSAAGELAGAADQRNSDISQAVSKVISDHEDTLRDLIAEYSQTEKSVLDGFKSS